MTHDVEHAAALDAGRCVVVVEVHGHVHHDGCILAETQEIDMDDEVAHRFELYVTRNDAFLLAADLDIEHVAHEGAGLVKRVDLLVAHMDELGGLLLAIDNGGDAALAAERTDSPLAAFFACLGCERMCLGHSKFSNENGALQARANGPQVSSRGVEVRDCAPYSAKSLKTQPARAGEGGGVLSRTGSKPSVPRRSGAWPRRSAGR